MNTIELIKLLKSMPETAEVCIDDGGGGLLSITSPRMASTKEKAEAGRAPENILVIIPAKTGLD